MIGIYAALVIVSTGLGIFVVYGRLVRQLVPFMCLATAYSANRFMQDRRWKPRVAWIAGLVLVLQTSMNFARPIQQEFPADVLAWTKSTYGPVRLDMTFETTLSLNRSPSRYVLLNVTPQWDVTGTKPIPEGEVLFRSPHPFGFLPYQYDGFTPRERAVLRRGDTSMILVDTRPD